MPAAAVPPSTSQGNSSSGQLEPVPQMKGILGSVVSTNQVDICTDATLGPKYVYVLICT